MQMKWLDNMKNNPQSFAVLGFLDAAIDRAPAHPMEQVKEALSKSE
jgi:hypothetical protein